MDRRTGLAALLLLAPAVALAGFSVSSERVEGRFGSTSWGAAAALDGDGSTAWRIDPQARNEGQWIEIGLPRSEVTGIGVNIGWDRDEKTFHDHARIKKARVELFGSASDAREQVLDHEVTFEDTRGLQVIELPRTQVGGDLVRGRLRLTVTEVYPGVDFPQLAVSEVLVHLAEIDVPRERIRFRTPPSSEAEGREGPDMFDGSARTFWAATEPTASFTIEAGSYGLSSIGIRPGPNTHARPKTVEVTMSHVTRTLELADRNEVQWFQLPTTVGFTGSAWGAAEIKVTEVYEGREPGVAIGEIRLRATTFDGI